MKYYAGNASIVCPCCGNDTFDKDYRQLNSRGATFFGIEWANKNATILVCENCTYIAWFMSEPSSDED